MTTIVTIASASPSAEDQRRARILEGAMRVFLAYGFQRTTMDDIAKAAEISRPALYVLFRNKTDIYRALVMEFLDRTINNSRAVLAGEGPLEERLGKSLFCTLDMMSEIEASPHGAEILDMKNSLAGDLVASGRKRYQDVVEAAITREVASLKGSGMARPAGPDLLAEMLLDAIDGMKQRNLPAEVQHRLAQHYIAIVALACGRGS